MLSLDYDLDVPSRGLSLDWTATFANISDTEVVVTLDLAISGPNGDVRLVGTYGADGGTLHGQGERRPVRHGHPDRPAVR